MKDIDEGEPEFASAQVIETDAEVSGRGKGALPRDRPSSEPPPERVTLRLTPRAHALFTELRRALDDDPEELLSDDALVEALASQVLRPPARP